MQTKTSSRQSEPKEDIVDLTLIPTSLPLIPSLKSNQVSQQSATVASPHPNKKTISSAKSKTCKNSSQTPMSSPTSAQVSTSNEKVLTPYWNERCQELSSNLWLPTKIDLRASDLISSTSWFGNPVERSWFYTTLYKVQNQNLPKISLQSSMFSPVECTGSEDTPKRSKKIRIYPNKEQVQAFKYFFAGQRAAYNAAVEYLKTPGTIANWKDIKTDLIHKLSEQKPWLNDVPYQIRSLAIREACIAVRDAKAKFRKTGEFQEVHFKRFKNPEQSCYIPHQAIKAKDKSGTIYVDAVAKYISELTQTKKDRKNSNIEMEEKLPSDYGDSRLVLDKGRWFLCVSYVVKSDPQSDESPIADVDNQDKRIVALDPGIRSFMTFYSTDSCGKLGEGAFKEIQDLGFAIDRMISLKANTSKKLRFKRRNFQRKINKMRHRIKDLVSELHHKVALFLVDNFDVILLPEFKTQGMVNKKMRKIGRKTVRNMMSFSFYKFSLILKDKAMKLGKIVEIVTEEYTSKTASWTGEVKWNQGSARWITSNGEMVDRDFNGARGILIKWLSAQAPMGLVNPLGLGRSPFFRLSR